MLLTEQRRQTRALQALSKDVRQMSRTLRRDSGQLVCAVNGLMRAITQLSRHQQETNNCLKAIAVSIAGGAKEDAPAPAPPIPVPRSPALYRPSPSSDGPGRPVRGRPSESSDGPGRPVRGRPSASSDGPGRPVRGRPSASSDAPSTSQTTRALRSRPVKTEQSHTIPK